MRKNYKYDNSLFISDSMPFPRPCQRAIIILVFMILVNTIMFLISPNSPGRVREQYRAKHHASAEVTDVIDDTSEHEYDKDFDASTDISDRSGESFQSSVK